MMLGVSVIALSSAKSVERTQLLYRFEQYPGRDRSHRREARVDCAIDGDKYYSNHRGSLLAQGISRLVGIIADVPGISMRTSGPGQTEIEMRGLASSGGASPTVGFYLDEVPLTAPPFTPIGKVVIDPDLFDLNRVEVLRGPQGTLYGAGSMGGTIKLLTNEPNLGKVRG